ncbi:hypothetical protein PBDP_1359 [Pseudomonas sp. St290]|nr:hypothetical protein PBDP_1359 [Pseudomonas sp. St290]
MDSWDEALPGMTLEKPGTYLTGVWGIICRRTGLNRVDGLKDAQCETKFSPMGSKVCCI